MRVSYLLGRLVAAFLGLALGACLISLAFGAALGGLLLTTG